MTPDEINRKVAELKEPLATLTGNSSFTFGNRSPLGYWILVCLPEYTGAMPVHDFTGDPALWSGLLGEMAQLTGFTVTISIDPNGYTCIDGLGFEPICGDTPGEAACLAYIKCKEPK